MKKQNPENQLLQLLKRVLPKATQDPNLAGQIYSAVEKELVLSNRAISFDKFCARLDLPDLEDPTIQTVQKQFKTTFKGADVTLKPNKKEKVLAVEVAMPDGAVFSGQIKVGPKPAEESEEQEVKLKFVPFPVVLPGDKELVWLLAKRENLTGDEAGISLAKVEEEFWGSKQGQKALRDRVERSFPEFISRVPAGLLNAAGLRRHYKTPEPLKILRSLRKG
jgi:hypothetical protein